MLREKHHVKPADALMHWSVRPDLSCDYASPEWLEYTGSTREQALGYHLFVLQFFLVAGCVARRAGEDLPAAYWGRLREMLEFVAALGEGGDALPMFGDADDGYLLDLGSGPGEVSGWLALGAALLEDEELARRAGPGRQAVAWLLGGQAVAWLDRVAATAGPGRPETPAASTRSKPHQRRTRNRVSDQKWTENQTSSG